MKNTKSILVILIIFFSINLFSNKNILEFNKDKTFKIVQFTDIHWVNNNVENCKKNIIVLETIIKAEKPDLIVLTGDIVVDDPIKDGWLAVTKPIIESGIPWAVVFGNHDSEHALSNQQIMNLIKTLPNNLSISGPSTISGCGNYIIPIKSSTEKKNSALLYMFDSHAYPSTPKIGSYDWIKMDQIVWYETFSKFYTRNNNNKPLPSLSFFHIPLPEYKDLVKSKKYVGNNRERVSSPMLNSGLFTKMCEMEDIMGVFVGHDHINDFAGIFNNICLAYGKVSGYDAYGDAKRGARIIELYEDEYRFNTWLRTLSKKKPVFRFPDAVYFNDDSYFPPKKYSNLKHGVNYNYYEGKVKFVEQIKKLEIKKNGVINNFIISDAESEDYFAFEFNSIIKIPEKGLYEFYTSSDDGSVLYIDDNLVVNNNGSHSLKKISGHIALDKGYHDIKVIYFEDHSGNSLEVGISSSKMDEQIISDNILYIK